MYYVVMSKRLRGLGTKRARRRSIAPIYTYDLPGPLLLFLGLTPYVKRDEQIGMEC